MICSRQHFIFGVCWGGGGGRLELELPLFVCMYTRDLHRRAAYSICESWFLIHQDVYHDLFVCS